ncbi:hypothetical protein HGA88_06855 [Candidatus Roizmanbacteria bacterium]|nr:hypothetical protein [Candidatus Roizmanbacteria bacterium]
MSEINSLLEVPPPPHIQLDAPPVEKILGTTDLAEVIQNPISVYRIPQLDEALQKFPLSSEHGKKHTWEDKLRYVATVITPQSRKHETRSLHKTEDENTEPNTSTGVIFLAGLRGTGAGQAHIVSDMCREIQQKLGIELRMTAGICSTASVETLGSLGEKYGRILPSSVVERAGMQASFIIDLLKQNPCNKIYLSGYSMGGAELGYMVPILEDLLKQNDMKTEIAGLIFAQAGGLYNQKLSEFLPAAQKVMSLDREYHEMFPTYEDEQRAQEELALAEKANNPILLEQKQKQLEEIQGKRINPPYASYFPQINKQLDLAIEKAKNEGKNQKKLLKKREEVVKNYDEIILLDKRIQTTLDNGKNPKDLLKRRKQLLKWYVEKIVTGPDARGQNFGIKGWLGFAKNLVLGPHGLRKQLPEQIRDSIKVPVAIITGDIDPYFGGEKAKEGLKYNTDGSIFKNARQTLNALVANWPHVASSSNSEKLGKIVADMVARMEETQEAIKDENGNPKATPLYY